MNKTLFKTTAKDNWVLCLSIILVILMYISISISMFNPDNVDYFEEILKMVPEGLLKAMGFATLGTDLTSYLAHYLYGFIFIMFPTIYVVVLANKLIAKHVDSGSMAYLLTTPNTRVKIALTQGLFLISSIAVIFIVNVVIAIILSESLHKGLLDINKFIALNWITFLVIVTISGISFFFSCLFNDTKNSLSFGVGIPLGLFVIKMLSEINTDLEWLKYLTLYSFVNIEEILKSNSFIIYSSIFLIIFSLFFYISAIIIFNRKSLSI